MRRARRARSTFASRHCGIVIWNTASNPDSDFLLCGAQHNRKSESERKRQITVVRFVGTAAPNLAPQARAARRLRNLEENARLRWYSLPGRRRPTSLRRPARRVRRGSAPDPGIDRREWTRRLAACGLRRGRRSYTKHESKESTGSGVSPATTPPDSHAPRTSLRKAAAMQTPATCPSPDRISNSQYGRSRLQRRARRARPTS